LLEAHTAVGAYDLLKRLQDEDLGTHPPVAYRALDFLVKHGLAHKIEHLNAYVACSHPHSHQTPVILICEQCETVAEIHVPQDTSALEQAASENGFTITRAVQEARGLCPECRGAVA
jgi:Fur family zinc uptake transcriptional regulator